MFTPSTSSMTGMIGGPDAAIEAGFAEVDWIEPADSGFYQPILFARTG